MNISELQQEIIKLKKEKDICILAHSYQAREICEIADFTGDSYKLSVDAAKAGSKTILLCGVRFMAETCKILSPDKTVILSAPSAGCDMADQMDKATVAKVKESCPDCTVVAYVNTTADLKTVCDVCVTSSSAVKIVNNIENKNILFIPDCNLGAHVAAMCPDKNIKLLNGGCPVHASVTPGEARKAKALYPGAELLVHPECVPAVCEQADYIGSTSGIIDYAMKSDKKEFIIGTESSIVSHLQFSCPEKRFYLLSRECVCHNMKMTTLPDVLMAVRGIGGEEICLSDQTIRDARRCIDRMIELGG